MKQLALLLLALGVGACGGGKMTPAPPPLRPKPVETAPVIKHDTSAPADCEPAKDTLGALTYGQRSIPESEGLVKESNTKMGQAGGQGVDEYTRQTLFTQAVDDLIAALTADPYNVNATYALAAAYAMIDRPQCSINMLERLIQMRMHPSKKTAVDAKLDVLLGRRKQTLDPSFRDLRTDPRFRELIATVCGGTDDPGCVFGH